MRIYAVLAHPNKESLSGHLFYNTVDHLIKQNVTVDILDLYQQADRIPFYVPPTTIKHSSDSRFDFYFENKERFMVADRLFIVYPVYWYATPGILKCWLDLITNYAWRYQKGHCGIPLHHIKKALVINSASMPNWYRWLCTQNSATEMMKQSFKFLGINNYHFYEIGNTKKITPDQVNKHLTKILKKSDWLVK